MAAKMKRRKLVWLIFITISILFVFLVLYVRHKLGRLDCNSNKGAISFRRYLLLLKRIFVESESDNGDRALLCGQEIRDLWTHILTKQLPQDAKYYLVDYWESESELQEFVFRILVVVGFVSLTIFCNFCKWMTANELHYDDDYEEKTIKLNISKAVVEKNSKIPNSSSDSRLPRPVGDKVPEESKKNLHGGCRSWSIWTMIGVIFVILTLISIPWEFVRLYQKEVSKRAAQASVGAPPECFPGEMSIIQSLKSWLQRHLSWDHAHDPCEKYYYTLLVDPLWELTPLMVLSSAMTRCILHPVEQLFSGLGRSCRMFFAEIPAQWQPIIMVLVILLALMLLLVMFSYRISIPLLFKIEPKTPVQNNEQVPPKKQPLSCSPSPWTHDHIHNSSSRPTLTRLPMRSKGRKLRLEYNHGEEMFL